MSEHPAIALAAAVGMPDAYAGELPVCFVSLRAGAEVSDALPPASQSSAAAVQQALDAYLFEARVEVG